MSLLATDDDQAYARDFQQLIATTSKPGRPFADHAWQIATRFVPLVHRMSGAIAIERAMIDAAAGAVVEGQGGTSFRALAMSIASEYVDRVLRGAFALELERAFLAAAAAKQASLPPPEEDALTWQRDPAAASVRER